MFQNLLSRGPQFLTSFYNFRESMLLYCDTRYELQAGKGSEYQDWIASDENQEILE